MVENRRPSTITVPIAIGWTQTVEIKDQLDEILPVEDFLLLLSEETTSKIVAELEKSYTDPSMCDYPILPQFLTVVYMKLRKIKHLSALYRELRAKDGRLAEKLDYKLTFLMKYDRTDEVGYYYRNTYVKEYIYNPAEYEKEYHKRSAEKSGNNVIKNGLVDTENTSYGMGLVDRNLHVKWCILAMQVVALIRAQHGRTGGGSPQ